jgi:DNA-binding TFAR19-related protein (PDSD5 family)
LSDELERIKLKKLEELRRHAAERQKQEEDKKKAEEAKKKILVAVLEPEAARYLGELRGRDAATATEIEDIIMRAVLTRELKYRLEAVDLEALERRIKGIEPRIVIKRRGRDEVDFDEKLKEDAEK